MNKDMSQYLDSIKRRPEDMPKVTYIHPRIDAMRRMIASAKARLEQPDVTDDVRMVVEEQLAKAESDLSELLKETPSLEFVFVKVSAPNFTRISAQTEDAYNAEYRKLVTTEAEDIIRRVRDAYSNDALLHCSDKSDTEFTSALQALIVDAVLNAEGFSPEECRYVENSNPELDLTEQEELLVRDDDGLVGVSAVDDHLEKMEQRERIVKAKREAIIRRNLEAMEQRRSDLLTESVDALLGKLVKLELMKRARDHAEQITADLTLYYEACDASKPIIRENRTLGYERMFSDVEDIKTLREQEDMLYAWMLEQHSVLNQMTGLGVLKDLATYEPFRIVLETLPDGAGTKPSPSV